MKIGEAMTFKQALLSGRNDIIKCKQCLYFHETTSDIFPGDVFGQCRIKSVFNGRAADDFCGEGLFVRPNTGRLDK